MRGVPAAVWLAALAALPAAAGFRCTEQRTALSYGQQRATIVFETGDGSSITPTDDDMLELMASMGFVDPACAEGGAVYTDGENTIFVL